MTGNAMRSVERRSGGRRGNLALAAFVLAVGPFVACRSGGTPEPELDVAASAPDSIHVSVTNQNWQNFSIYALFGESRRYLGLVTTMQSQAFSLSRRLAVASELRLLAIPIGGDSPLVSERILGQDVVEIEWTLVQPISNSYLTYY